MSRILFLTYRLRLGFGVDVVVSELGRRLVGLGHEVTVGCLEKDADYTTLPSVIVPPSAEAIRRVAKMLDCDLVVAHTSPFMEVMPKLGRGIRTFVWEHGDPTPDLFDLDREERRGQRNYKIKHVYPRVDGVVAISSFVRDDIRWPSSRIVYNGCNHVADRGSKPRDALFDAQGRTMRVGTLMRLGEGEARYKGNARFLSLARCLRVENAPVQFCVMGRGTDADAAKFRNRGFEVHLNATDEEKADYLRGLDVFVSPSSWEGFNLPLVEAQALGTLGLAFDGGAHPETTPYVFRTTLDMYRFIRTLASCPDLVHDGALRGYRYVRNTFSWDRAASEASAALGLEPGEGSTRASRNLGIISRFGRATLLLHQVRQSLSHHGAVATSKKVVVRLGAAWRSQAR